MDKKSSKLNKINNKLTKLNIILIIDTILINNVMSLVGHLLALRVLRTLNTSDSMFFYLKVMGVLGDIHNLIFNPIFICISIIINFFVIIKNIKLKKYENLKLIFWTNILSLYVITRLVYSDSYDGILKYTMPDYIYNEFLFNIMPYFLILITTIFNIPILYIISNKVIKNTLIASLIKVVLVAIFSWNLFLPS